MENFNSVLVEGNLVRDTEIRETPNGKLVANFALACNRDRRTANGTYESEPSFFDVESWGDVAQMAHDTCKKGTFIRVIGKLRQNRWTDKEGKRCARVIIVAESIELKSKARKNEAAEVHAAILENEREARAERELAAVGMPEEELVF